MNPIEAKIKRSILKNYPSPPPTPEQLIQGTVQSPAPPPIAPTAGFASGGTVRKKFSPSKFPAGPQLAGRTGQHSGKAAGKRTGAKVRSAAVDQAGDCGGSPAASQPRRPAA
jgi:hypothetical protein